MPQLSRVLSKLEKAVPGPGYWKGLTALPSCFYAARPFWGRGVEGQERALESILFREPGVAHEFAISLLHFVGSLLNRIMHLLALATIA